MLETYNASWSVKEQALYFSNISDLNLCSRVKTIAPEYMGTFWDSFIKFKTYERIVSSTILDVLKLPGEDLGELLKHKVLVDRFDETIADFMRESIQTPSLIVSKYLKKNHPKEKIYFPKLLKPDEYEMILRRYIDLDMPGYQDLCLIADAPISGECPISESLRLCAKERKDSFWRTRVGTGNGFTYGVKVCFDITESILSFKKKPVTEITYNRKWINDNLDYPTLMNNFIYLFGYTDRCFRCTFPSFKSENGCYEQFGIIEGEKHYTINNFFRWKEMKSSAEMCAYRSELSRHNIRLEDIMEWFFSKYLVDEFGVTGFVFNAPSTSCTIVEKCRNIASEMDGVLKQFSMYVQNKSIDRREYELSSSTRKIEDIPSLISNKYAYIKDKQLYIAQQILFKTQKKLIVPHNKKRFQYLRDILKEGLIKLTYFRVCDRDCLYFLKEEGIIEIDENEIISPNQTRIWILEDFFCNEVICPYHYNNAEKTEVDELFREGKIEYRSTLFSKPEQDYLDFLLDKAKFCNGYDLRNKYIHSTYSLNKETQIENYVELIKIMIIVIIKINDELCNI